MYLQENLRRLNEQYNSFGIYFEYDGNIIRLKERPKYSLNKHESIKQRLTSQFKLKFSSELLWHIKKDGINILKSRRIKTEPKKPISELRNELMNYIEMISEDILRESIKNLLSNNNEFFNLPAAKLRHHAYEGGLLEHTLQTLNLSIKIMENLKDEIKIDKNIIIAGAILHDIGKINCYKFDDSGIEITDIFLEQEHIINGVKILSQFIKSEKLNELIHIVASHHNIKDWGSPVEPRSTEAWIIHMTENLSSKILG